MTSERRLREAAAARLALMSAGEAESSDEAQECQSSTDVPKKANMKVRVRKKAAASEEHVKEQEGESLTKPERAPEEVIREKTLESAGHLLTLFDSPAATPPTPDSASSLEKILNP